MSAAGGGQGLDPRQVRGEGRRRDGRIRTAFSRLCGHFLSGPGIVKNEGHPELLGEEHGNCLDPIAKGKVPCPGAPFFIKCLHQFSPMPA